MDSICEECGFRLSITVEEASALITSAPARFRAALDGQDKVLVRTPTVLPWSASAYVWHLADVLRISAERLWALAHDADAAIVSYDPDALAAVRRYAQQSPAAGLGALERSTADWLLAWAAIPPHRPYDHPEFGRLAVGRVAGLVGHEVEHHAWDVGRCLGTGVSPSMRQTSKPHNVGS